MEQHNIDSSKTGLPAALQRYRIARYASIYGPQVTARDLNVSERVVQNLLKIYEKERDRLKAVHGSKFSDELHTVSIETFATPKPADGKQKNEETQNSSKQVGQEFANLKPK